MSLKTRGLICLVIMATLIFQCVNLSVLSKSSTSNDDDGHELIMNVEEPYREVRTTISSSNNNEEQVSNESEDFEPPSPQIDQSVYDRLLASDLNIPVVNLDFRQLRSTIKLESSETNDDNSVEMTNADDY